MRSVVQTPGDARDELFQLCILVIYLDNELITLIIVVRLLRGVRLVVKRDFARAQTRHLIVHSGADVGSSVINKSC